jgi:hypothetical protein
MLSRFQKFCRYGTHSLVADDEVQSCTLAELETGDSEGLYCLELYGSDPLRRLLGVPCNKGSKGR